MNASAYVFINESIGRDPSLPPCTASELRIELRAIAVFEVENYRSRSNSSEPKAAQHPFWKTCLYSFMPRQIPTKLWDKFRYCLHSDSASPKSG